MSYSLSLYNVHCFICLVTEISTHPISLTTTTALEDITLMCSASVDDVKYSWHHVNGHIPHRSQGQHTDTFTIYRVTPHDEGMYYCVIKKSGIHVYSNNALIRVDGKIINYLVELLFVFERQFLTFRYV